MINNKMDESKEKPAIPEKWITPIRLVMYLLLAGCSAYIFYNSHELELTHYIVFMAIAAVCSMALLDCKMSSEYWRKQNDEKQH